MPSSRPPLALVVLDGWGLREDPDHNAIALADTPTYQEVRKRYPTGSLITSGEAVGLPPGQMGNSEVGHMNLGAGRIVFQDLTRIDQTIQDGSFFDNAGVRGRNDPMRGRQSRAAPHRARVRRRGFTATSATSRPWSTWHDASRSHGCSSTR